MLTLPMYPTSRAWSNLSKSAWAERSLSRLGLIKTNLRSSMGRASRSGRAVISISAHKLSYDDLIKRFLQPEYAEVRSCLRIYLMLIIIYSLICVSKSLGGSFGTFFCCCDRFCSLVFLLSIFFFALSYVFFFLFFFYSGNLILWLTGILTPVQFAPQKLLLLGTFTRVAFWLKLLFRRPLTAAHILEDPVVTAVGYLKR